MKQKEPKKEKRVRVTVTYECGKCGNVQRRDYESTEGLLELPRVYCGECIRFRSFTVLTAVISKAEAFEVDPEAEEAEEVEQIEHVGEVSEVKPFSDPSKMTTSLVPPIPEQ